jgi:S-DNA-T family DNA segregation ATPase FtsK/SpoIIIE
MGKSVGVISANNLWIRSVLVYSYYFGGALGRKRKYPKKKQSKPKWFQREDEWGRFVFDWTLGLSGETWREIFGAGFLIIGLIAILGFFHTAGSVGNSFATISRSLVGLAGFLLPASFCYWGVILIFPNKHGYRISNFLGFVLFFLALPLLLQLFVDADKAVEVAKAGLGGGAIGYQLSVIAKGSIGTFGAFLVALIVLAISLMMVLNTSIAKILGLKGISGEEEDDGRVNVNQGQDNRVSVFTTVKRKMSNMKFGRTKTEVPVMKAEQSPAAALRNDANWTYPPLDLLKESDEVASSGNIPKNVEIIQRALKNFGMDVTMQDVNIGPTVTQYTLKPAEGVKLNQITARSNDLALSLAAKSLRVEAPIPGKSAVGVEIPNKIPAKVTLKEVLQSGEFKGVKSKLAIALGRDVAGVPMGVDLEKMPHLLIAGSTGSGKSVCINSVIITLLYNNSPADLRFLMVDPKRVELTCYNGIPHLLAPVITEVDRTVSALKWAVHEMERRYKVFAETGKRNISAYNANPPDGKMPYIVIIIDELADLMAAAANDVEGSIVRLAQMARATGIHLIVATQRPSVDVITGLIKANITSRIAFAVASQVDSRTILDMSGAEKLLGKGDMLFISSDVPKPKRVQGCHVTDPEIESVVEFLRTEGTAEYDDTILTYRQQKGMSTADGGEIDDDLYEEARDTVMRAGKGSASLLQRRLRVGYARAARLLDILEQEGVIGPADGAKPREVLITDTGSEQFQGDDEQY